MLGLAYIFLAISTHLLLKGFTFMSMCGMNQGLTSVRILLSLSPLSPDTGTGSGFLHRTLVGPLAQLLSKQTSQRLTRLHILSPRQNHIYHSSSPTCLHLGELAEEVWDRVVDIDLRGVFLCMKHEIPL